VLAARRNSRGVALLAARAAEDAGQYQRALSLAVSHFGSDVSRPTPGAPADLAALAYPRAYWEDVRTAGEAHDVEPWLMLALARKESLFDTTARSAAGAIGMFQLMPATAGLVAADAGVESADEEALLQPSQAARLAGRLLRTLLDRYDGKLPAVIAAYNAGHERVDLWWKTGASVSEDLFIDTIPYSETRRYVREVLSNLRRYREIYGKAER
jgi:soluble lytic murein transglycosylase